MLLAASLGDLTPGFHVDAEKLADRAIAKVRRVSPALHADNLVVLVADVTVCFLKKEDFLGIS